MVSSDDSSQFCMLPVRLITGIRRYEHITPTLHDTLHLLPISQRITFKIAVMMFDCSLLPMQWRIQDSPEGGGFVFLPKKSDTFFLVSLFVLFVILHLPPQNLMTFFYSSISSLYYAFFLHKI